MGSQGYGIDHNVARTVADEVVAAHGLGVELGIVIGGGNIFRGMSAGDLGIDRVSADHIGMLATVMNSPGSARRAGEAGPRHACDERAADGQGRGAVHSPACRSAPAEAACGHLRGRHGQSVLFHGHGRGPASARDRRGRADEGHEGRGSLHGRSRHRPERRTHPAYHIRSSSRRSGFGSWTPPRSRTAWRTGCRSTSSTCRNPVISSRPCRASPWVRSSRPRITASTREAGRMEMNSASDVLIDAQNRMKAAVESMARELQSVRTGRANISILNDVCGRLLRCPDSAESTGESRRAGRAAAHHPGPTTRTPSRPSSARFCSRISA